MANPTVIPPMDCPVETSFVNNNGNNSAATAAKIKPAAKF